MRKIVYFLFFFALSKLIYGQEKSVKIIAQEYTFDFHTPVEISSMPTFPGSWREIWVWWAWGNYNPYKLDNSPWRRNISSKGYPYIGPYDSRCQEVIRWQIRLAKNTGLEGLLAILNSGEDGFFNEKYLDILEYLFDIADEEQFKIGIQDAVAFGNNLTKNRTQTTLRTIDILQKYKDNPAYLKISGQPIYHFNFYGHLNNWTYADLEQYMEDVENAVGDVFWMIQYGTNSEVLANDNLDAIQHIFIHPLFSNTTEINWDDYRTQARNFVSSVHDANKVAAVNVFPGFDEEKLKRPEQPRFVYRENGETYSRQLEICKDVGFDYVVVSSWNDWCENHNIEPGWDFDDYVGDPYQYLRITSEFLGNEFIAPDLPPREYVDELMWGKLYGIDKAGPYASKFNHDSSKVTIKFEDDISNVSGAECFVDGTHWVRVKRNSQENQLRLIIEGDGITDVVIKDSREARVPLASNVYYHYFDDTTLQKGDHNVFISVEYYDEGTQEFRIDYQSTSKIWESTPFHFKEDTRKWKTAFFYLEHAAFGNGQNYGADFRISSPHHDLAVARVGVLIPGEGFKMTPVDGNYDSSIETVEIYLQPSSDNDLHGLHIRGKDSAGNWSYNWFSELIKLPTSQTGLNTTNQTKAIYFSLLQNYPNPFNPTTTIRFQLPKHSKISIRIYNLLGHEVRMLVDKDFEPGLHTITWDGSNNNGGKVTSGIYFFRLQTENYDKTNKMMLIR